MGTNFPGSLDSYSTKNNGDTISEAHINDLQLAIVKIEEKVGTGVTATASTNTALLGTGASNTGYSVISLGNSSLVTGTLTAARGGTGVTNTNTAGGAVILNGAGLLTGKMLGAWSDVSAAAAHDDETAATDGFVVGYIYWAQSGGTGISYVVDVYTDASSPAGTIREKVILFEDNAHIYAGQIMAASWCVPVKKGDYWRIIKTNANGTINTFAAYWVVSGS